MFLYFAIVGMNNSFVVGLVQVEGGGVEFLGTWAVVRALMGLNAPKAQVFSKRIKFGWKWVIL